MKALVVGTGSFAEKLCHLLIKQGVVVVAFIDEFRAGTWQDRPVFRAGEAPASLLEAPDTCVFTAISTLEHSVAAEERLLARGVGRGRILRLENDSALLILERMLALAEGQFLDLVKNHGGNFSDLEAAIFDERNPDPAQISFRVFNRGQGFLSHLDQLPDELASEYETELLADEPIAGRNSRFCSQQRAMKREAGLVITPQTHPCSPDHTPKLTLIHALYDSLMLRDSIAEALAQPQCHYLGLASRASFRQFQEICRTHQLANVVLLPAGYPKLDRAIREYRRLPGITRRTLLYAPTQCVTRKEGLGAGYSMDQARDLLESLLAADRDLNIIFRPHPEDLSLVSSGLNTPTGVLMEDLIRWTDGHPRLTLDNRPSQKESYARADVLLTDTSSTAFSFSFATENPVLFFSADDQDLLGKAGHLQFIQDRSQVGRVCQDTAQVVSAYQDLAGRPEAYSASIKALRRQSVFNLGHSLEYYRLAVKTLMAGGRPDQGWNLERERMMVTP